MQARAPACLIGASTLTARHSRAPERERDRNFKAHRAASHHEIACVVTLRLFHCSTLGPSSASHRAPARRAQVDDNGLVFRASSAWPPSRRRAQRPTGACPSRRQSRVSARHAYQHNMTHVQRPHCRPPRVYPANLVPTCHHGDERDPSRSQGASAAPPHKGARPAEPSEPSAKPRFSACHRDAGPSTAG